MKKQKQVELKPAAFSEMVQQHKMKEVSPPDSARRDPMIMNKAKGETIAKAAKEWMRTAKSQNPSAGFLDVASENLKPTLGQNSEMLYKGQKKE